MSNHLGVEVFPPGKTDGYQALVSVIGFPVTAHRISAYEDAQCVCSGLPAAIRATIHSIALLLSLRGVDAVKPDLSFAYVEGVAVNDTGLACDVGVGGKRQEGEEDCGECEGDA